ncbi:MAG: cation:proton antiporter [Candidatus Methanomethylophilus sp.]|nr:cation:proton antiporter [Methanomethylophilus sp.]
MLIAPILLMLLVLFVLARTFSAIIERFGFPGLIGEIIVGILIANIAIDGTTLVDVLDLQDGTNNNSILFTFSELGVIFLLFSVGLETRVKDLLGSGKTAFFVALLGVIVPFLLGFAYLTCTGGEFEAAMFLAAAMVATSVGITARVIKDMKLMDKFESRIIIAAVVIDDVLGMIVLAIVKGIAGSEGGLEILDLFVVIAKAVIFVIGVILLAKYGVPKIASWWVSADRRTKKPLKAPNPLVLAIACCFFFAWLAEEIGLAAIIGSFLAGMLFADYAETTGLINKFETITALFISFFFVHVGLQVEIGAFNNLHAVVEVVIIIGLAVLSKYIGCGCGAKLADRSISKESFNIIGFGMVPRGEVGIIIASIGLTGGILSNELYSVIVMMAVATTIIAPPILSTVFRRKYNDHVHYEIE